LVHRAGQWMTAGLTPVSITNQHSSVTASKDSAVSYSA